MYVDANEETTSARVYTVLSGTVKSSRTREQRVGNNVRQSAPGKPTRQPADQPTGNVSHHTVTNQTQGPFPAANQGMGTPTSKDQAAPPHLYGRLHHRGSKLYLRSYLRLTLKTVAPFEFRAGLEIEIKVHVEPPKWAVRNLDPRSAAIVDKIAIPVIKNPDDDMKYILKTAQGQRRFHRELCYMGSASWVTTIYDRQKITYTLIDTSTHSCPCLLEYAVSKSAHLATGHSTQLKPAYLATVHHTPLPMSDWLLHAVKDSLLAGAVSWRVGDRALMGERRSNILVACAAGCNWALAAVEPRYVVVRLLASHQGEPGSIPGGVVPEFAHVEIVLYDAAGRRVFLGISRRCSIPRFTLINCQNQISSLALSLNDCSASVFASTLQGVTGDLSHVVPAIMADPGTTPRRPANSAHTAARRTPKLDTLRNRENVCANISSKPLQCLNTLMNWSVLLVGFCFRRTIGLDAARQVRCEVLIGKGHYAMLLVSGTTLLEFVVREAVSLLYRKRLGCSPSTKGNRVQSPVGSLPDFRMWESYRMMPMVCMFSRGSPVSPAPSFQRYSILTSVTLIGSQDQALPNIFTHSLTYLKELKPFTIVGRKAVNNAMDVVKCIHLPTRDKTRRKSIEKNVAETYEFLDSNVSRSESVSYLGLYWPVFAWTRTDVRASILRHTIKLPFLIRPALSIDVLTADEGETRVDGGREGGGGEPRADYRRRPAKIRERSRGAIEPDSPSWEASIVTTTLPDGIFGVLPTISDKKVYRLFTPRSPLPPPPHDSLAGRRQLRAAARSAGRTDSPSTINKKEQRRAPSCHSPTRLLRADRIAPGTRRRVFYPEQLPHDQQYRTLASSSRSVTMQDSPRSSIHNTNTSSAVTSQPTSSVLFIDVRATAISQKAFTKTAGRCTAAMFTGS
ncbi:hypothetical protein PR048_014392 [Dryococelus australis]|uniref:Uncharacterized protein n=1 Tax=Dryococelus australis TaxID=614101 RepID=A0ABQ9HE41_9NEOP|nr:hypothetical protein PR048_014392 [Dryococelus australis]